MRIQVKNTKTKLVEFTVNAGFRIRKFSNLFGQSGVFRSPFSIPLDTRVRRRRARARGEEGEPAASRPKKKNSKNKKTDLPACAEIHDGLRKFARLVAMSVNYCRRVRPMYFQSIDYPCDGSKQKGSVVCDNIPRAVYNAHCSGSRARRGYLRSRFTIFIITGPFITVVL